MNLSLNLRAGPLCPFTLVVAAHTPGQRPWPHEGQEAPAQPIPCIGSCCMLWSFQGHEGGTARGRCALGTRLIQDPVDVGRKNK